MQLAEKVGANPQLADGIAGGYGCGEYAEAGYVASFGGSGGADPDNSGEYGLDSAEY